MLLLKIALRNLRGNYSFSLFFILNLSIGLIGYTLLDAFKESLSDSIESRSKEMATSDIQITGRRIFTDQEVNTANKALEPYISDKTHVTAMFSMASHSEKSRLVELKAIEENFPLYGKMTLEQDVGVDKVHTGQYALLYPELLLQLGVSIGDPVRVGATSYEVIGTIKEDAGVSRAGAAAAPRIYISKNYLENADLIQKGSSVWNSYLYKLKDDSLSETALTEVKSALKEPSIKISGHLEAGQQSGRLIGYLNDYLGLVSLAAFFLAAIGAAFLYRSYLSTKLATTATLISLGVTPVQAFFVAIIEILLISITSASIATVFSATLLPILPKLVGDFIPTAISVSIGLGSVLASFMLATVGSLAVCLPLINSSSKIKPAILFQEARHETIPITKKDLVWYIPGLVVFWLVAVWQSNSMAVGSIFFSMFVGGGVCLYFIGMLLLSLIGKIAPRFSFPVKSALIYMNRRKFASITCFLALSLGSMLITLIPSLRESIYSEIQNPDGKTVPSLFLFDIQEDQVESLASTLKDNGAESSLLSPMVRARLKKVNDEIFTKKEKSGDFESREEERSRAFSNRGYNLTYRDKLDSSETIVDGTFYSGAWSEESGKTPEISIEQRFADRLDLKLGDQLEFEVLGVAVVGQITSVRKIRWTTFQPNFFIQFQPGVLDGAPKTFVGAVNKIDDEKKKAALNASIVEKHPNISIIDVSRLVDRITEIIDRMSWALTFMAILCLFAGFIVLFSICRQQIKSRIWDISMLKVLGASFPTVQKSIVTEFLLIGLSASILGTGFSALLNFVLSTFVFEGVFSYSFLIPLFIIALVTSISVVVAKYTCAAILKSRAVKFLK